MRAYGPLDGYLERDASPTGGYAMGLVDIARLLNNIDKKLYVLIKKQEECIGVLKQADNDTTSNEEEYLKHLSEDEECDETGLVPEEKHEMEDK